MYKYLRTKIPNAMEAERTGPYKYEWRIVFGSMVGRCIRICLTEVFENHWTIDAFRELVREGRIINTSYFLYTCTMPNEFAKHILNEIGEWLCDFDNYRKMDDEQNNGDLSKANYKVELGR